VFECVLDLLDKILWRALSSCYRRMICQLAFCSLVLSMSPPCPVYVAGRRALYGII
jgi:hypothetical protein